MLLEKIEELKLNLQINDYFKLIPIFLKNFFSNCQKYLNSPKSVPIIINKLVNWKNNKNSNKYIKITQLIFRYIKINKQNI